MGRPPTLGWLGALPVLVGLMGACDGRPPEIAIYKRSFLAFGTTVRIEIAEADPAAAAAAADDLQNFFAAVDADWYAWGNGELSRVNAALARGEQVLLSERLAPLIASAIAIHERSGGLFDPAVADLVELWKFDRLEHLAAATAPPPPAAIEAARVAAGTTGDLRLVGRQLTSRRPLRLDLGGLAKGVALEECRRRLAAHGIRNALVDVGGSSLLALGHRGSRAWRVGVQDPRARPIFGVLELADGETVSTSGDYARYFDAGGTRHHHVLDPRTGLPATGAAAVTVIDRDGALADGASTALMVGGPDRFAELAGRLGVDSALLVTLDGRLLATPSMEVRLRRSNGGRLPHPTAGQAAAARR